MRLYANGNECGYLVIEADEVCFTSRGEFDTDARGYGEPEPLTMQIVEALGPIPGVVTKIRARGFTLEVSFSKAILSTEILRRVVSAIKNSGIAVSIAPHSPYSLRPAEQAPDEELPEGVEEA